jgi:pimeloyl-ACP methyl ester carboxylesterase/bifunctional DNA-binding transcriptional regulator/antitoxin component of YhaV-PrlF toxin-antitoxin module
VPTVENRGIRIHYEVHGSGHPVVLIHGGTVSFKHNYADFGWIESLNGIGLQVIGLDLRGHGKSDKPQEVESYGTSNLASDVIAVLDRLSLTRASLVAYSIGTAVALQLLQSAPERFDRAALIATGDGLVGHPSHTFANLLPSLLEVLGRTEYPKDLPKHLSTYWNLVAATDGNWQALRALAQARYAPLAMTDAAANSSILHGGGRLQTGCCRVLAARGMSATDQKQYFVPSNSRSQSGRSKRDHEAPTLNPGINMSMLLVSSKGQIVLPAEMWRRLVMGAGARIEVLEESDGLRLRVVRSIATTDMTNIAGMVKAPSRGAPRSLEDFDPVSLLTRSRRGVSCEPWIRRFWSGSSSMMPTMHRLPNNGRRRSQRLPNERLFSGPCCLN